jgi:catalase
MLEKKSTNSISQIEYCQDFKLTEDNSFTFLQNFSLQEKLAQFNRERIPERIVHAKGTGAFGKLTVTHDITKYSCAKLFSEIGKETKLFVRFSTTGGERGAADTERDTRGFAVKFYTEDGNWDLVGNNTPVFFMNNPEKFPVFFNSQKRNHKTNYRDATNIWEYWSLNPESLHQVLILMTDRGTPKGYIHMNGYGCHTFSFLNKGNDFFYVKFHYKTMQGNKTFTNAEAIELSGTDPDFAQRELVNAIENGNYPKYALKIQIMDIKQAQEFQWNPFDLTKIWPHEDYPLINVGEIELNEIPENYFEDVEQVAFSPSNLVKGIGLSPDKMLQARIFAYPDAQRYRLGVNFKSLPINKCPFSANTSSRGNITRFNQNKDNLNNCLNIINDTFENIKYDDDYTQPNELFEKVMTEQQQQNTIDNIIEAMKGIIGDKKDEIVNRQLCHWFNVSEELGNGVAEGLNVKIDEVIIGNH